MNRLRGLGRILSAQIGLNMLSKSYKRYLLTYMLFTIGGTISSSYFSFFLLRATGSESSLRIYNLLIACVQPFIMLPALAVLKRWSVSVCMRIGLLIHTAAYALLAASGNADMATVYAVSAMLSSGNAFIFTAYTPQQLAYATDENRDACYGVVSVLSTIVSLVLPLTTGLFISRFDDLTGYSVLFAVSSLITLGSFAASFRLTPVVYGDRRQKNVLRRTMKAFLGSKKIWASMIATMLDAMRAHGFGFFSALLVFDLIGRESVMAVFSVATTIVNMMMSIAYTRMATPRNRGWLMLLGAVGYTIAVAIVCLDHTFTGYIMYALLSTIVSVFISNPVLTSYLSAVQNDSFLCQHGAEVHLLREVFVASGRVIGLLPAFLMPDPTEYAAVMMLLFAAVQIPAALLTKYLQRRVNLEQST